MAQFNRTLPAFIGGEEKTFEIHHAEREEASDEAVSLDLTGYTITAEIWHDGCRQICLNEANGGIVINDLAPADADDPEDQEPHYSVTLTEVQTRCLPRGKNSFLILIRESPEGVTTKRGPHWLNRTA